MELQSEVQERHVQEALRLMKVSMQQAALDQRTGMIDMDKLYSGIGAIDRETRKHLAVVISELLVRTSRPLSRTETLAGLPGVCILVNAICMQSVELQERCTIGRLCKQYKKGTHGRWLRENAQSTECVQQLLVQNCGCFIVQLVPFANALPIELVGCAALHAVLAFTVGMHTIVQLYHAHKLASSIVSRFWA
jgi:hypothetical protein